MKFYIWNIKYKIRFMLNCEMLWDFLLILGYVSLILLLLFNVVLKVLWRDKARQRNKAQPILEGKDIIISFPSNSILQAENHLPTSTPCWNWSPNSTNLQNTNGHIKRVACLCSGNEELKKRIMKTVLFIGISKL